MRASSDIMFRSCGPGFAGMPCMKRNYKHKKASILWLSSQERRALLAPLINRSPTGCQPLANRSSTSRWFLDPVFTWDFRASCLRRIVQDSCFRCPGEQDGRLSPWRIVPQLSWAHLPVAIQPRPAAPRRAPPLSARAARLAAVRRPAPSRP